jgi:Protein of unknown function (DUF3048) N-terminal domain/Protein of unknown function (DUF3048) C-terminal domain
VASADSVAPLTGLAVTAAVAQRPAVAVDVAGSDPVGLGSADVVFVEITSPVRYIAVFESAEATTVGPVTSTRPTDGELLSVLHPLLGYDGGTSSFISALHATKVIDDGYAAHATVYSAGHDGLTVSTVTLAAEDKSDGPPPPLFSYRAAGESLASVRVSHPTSVQVDIPGQPTEQWSFDSRADRWVETAGGPRVSVANLVVQIVAFKIVYLSRRYGKTVPIARVFGTGPVTVFSGAAPGQGGGTAATGIWRKPGPANLTVYLDSADVPMNFVPGPTWVLLAPSGTRTSLAVG